MKTYKKLNSNIISEINSSNEYFLISLKNTKSLSTKKLLKINNKKCNFMIIGGLNDIIFKSYYKSRITYSLDEIIKIIVIFESIEKNYTNNKTKNIIYIYDYIRKNIKYDENETDDRKIRSLLTIYTKKAVCSGYALLLKELLDRINVKCKYIKKYNHSWNLICINKKYYEVDITWDACIYNKYPSSNFHYFANNKDICVKHFNKIYLKNSYQNDFLNEYNLNVLEFTRNDMTSFKLTLLPIGIDRKYYLFEEKKEKYILSSLDDMEAILSECSNEIVSSYINCFFTLDRIKKYCNNNVSNIGYGLFKNNCFYRKKYDKVDNFIKKIEYNNSIFINTYIYRYVINDNYEMKRLKENTNAKSS